jgi:hypothetical protein
MIVRFSKLRVGDSFVKIDVPVGTENPILTKFNDVKAADKQGAPVEMDGGMQVWKLKRKKSIEEYEANLTHLSNVKPEVIENV